MFFKLTTTTPTTTIKPKKNLLCQTDHKLTAVEAKTFDERPAEPERRTRLFCVFKLSFILVSLVSPRVAWSVGL